MYVLNAYDVNSAYYHGLELLLTEGQKENSRAGEVLVLPRPLTMAYQHPDRRVLFDHFRDANPFFHIFEALWMMAGRSDARWLDKFVGDFSHRFAEDDGHQHGAYGYRWRRHFDLEGGGEEHLPDQLEAVIALLKKDPASRRAVVSMWDPLADLGKDKRDHPCNTNLYLRLQKVKSLDRVDLKLDMTVCCRSNDFVWGMTGANAVHFSVLQEYLAGRLGVGLGTYYQVANNCHVYTAILPKLQTTVKPGIYPASTPLGTDWANWDLDLRQFMRWTEEQGVLPGYRNAWFARTATPLYVTHALWKQGTRQEALDYLRSQYEFVSPDWYQAAVAWMERRLARAERK